MSQLTGSHEFYDKFLKHVIGNLPRQITWLRIDLDFTSNRPVAINMQILVEEKEGITPEFRRERFNLVSVVNNEGDFSDEVAGNP